MHVLRESVTRIDCYSENHENLILYISVDTAIVELQIRWGNFCENFSIISVNL